MAWQTPKTDWTVNPTNPVAADFNRIEGNIDFLKNEIETKKGAIVDALNTVGIETSISDTHSQIAGKILAADQGTKIITPGTSNITIPKGIHNGQGYVVGDPDLDPANIANGVNIFGVAGTHSAINKIQRGSVTLIVDQDYSLDVSIAPVDLSKSVVIIEGREISGAYWPQNVGLLNTYAVAYFLDNSTIRIERARNSDINLVVHWCVIEFKDIKSLQSGRFQTDNDGWGTITINPVDVNKSLVFHSYNLGYYSSGYLLPGTLSYIKLTSSTTLDYNIKGSGTLQWFVVEFI